MQGLSEEDVKTFVASAVEAASQAHDPDAPEAPHEAGDAQVPRFTLPEPSLGLARCRFHVEYK